MGEPELGGEGGIRTPDTVARMPHFECGAFNRSATSPVPGRKVAYTHPPVETSKRPGGLELIEAVPANLAAQKDRFNRRTA
jgi:hypothetical protein